MVWYHHGEEDGGGQKWGTPYLDEGWAQRLVPRSTGWKLVVTGGKQPAARSLFHLLSDQGQLPRAPAGKLNETAAVS
jgi:hypothetical protein